MAFLKTFRNRNTNPFKRLFRMASLSAVFRFCCALAIAFVSDKPLYGLMAFILCSQITDLLFFRPSFKRFFTSKSWSLEDEAWLKQKEDILPDELMVFFRRVLSIRATALSITLLSWGVLLFFLSPQSALISASIAYVTSCFFMLSWLTNKTKIPRGYRADKRASTYDWQTNEIRNWDITDPRGIAYRNHVRSLIS